MLIILLKTVVSTSTVLWQKVLLIPMTILLLKSIADTNTDIFVTILFTVYYIQQRSFFPRSSVNKVNRMIVVEKTANHDVNE